MSLEVLLFKAITAIIVRYGRLSIQRNDLKCLRRETNKYYDFYFFLNLSATPTPPKKTWEVDIIISILLVRELKLKEC